MTLQSAGLDSAAAVCLKECAAVRRLCLPQGVLVWIRNQLLACWHTADSESSQCMLDNHSVGSC
jgi:hypothetical protein